MSANFEKNSDINLSNYMLHQPCDNAKGIQFNAPPSKTIQQVNCKYFLCFMILTIKQKIINNHNAENDNINYLDRMYNCVMETKSEYPKRHFVTKKIVILQKYKTRICYSL